MVSRIASRLRWNRDRQLLEPLALPLANEQLAKDDLEPLPAGLTRHSLRRTFASLLSAIGESPPYVMAHMGHTTANPTLAIYARQIVRRDGEPDRLRALVNGDEWHPIGTRSQETAEVTHA